MFRRLRNFKSFDLLFDFVGERCRAGAVHNPMVKRQRKRNDFCALVFAFVRNQFTVRGTNEKRTDRWWHNNRRTRFHSKRAQTRDHHRRVHRINPPATRRSDNLVVTIYEFRPALLICVRDYRSGQAIVFERNRNAQIEIVILHDLIVFEN